VAEGISPDVMLYSGAGDGSFNSPTKYDTALRGGVGAIAVIDVNHDSHCDVVCLSNESPQSSVLLGTRGG
jgi:hypothetical protein